MLTPKANDRLTLLLLFCLLAFGLTTPALHAQEEEDSQPPPARDQARLNVYLDQSGPARIDLWLPVKVDDRQPLERAIAQSVSFTLYFHDPAEDEDLEAYNDNGKPVDLWWTMITGESSSGFSRSGLRSNCQINLQPLIDALRAHQIEHLQIGVGVVSATQDVTIEGAATLISAGLPDRNYYVGNLDLRAPAFYTVGISTGYRASTILKRTIPLLAFLLLPSLLTLGMALSARKFADRPPELWGRHLRFLSRMLTAIWLIWLPVYFLTQIGEILAFVVGPAHPSLMRFVDIGFYFLPPILAMWLCHLASSSVYRQVTGVEWSAREVVRRAILANIVSLTPMFLLILIVNTMGSSLRQAALYAVVGYVGWLLLHQSGKAFAPRLHALTSGDLRDRIFELAQRAEVTLKQIYVLPEERAQLSNAFARSDDSVMITNSLLKRLNRREVDAIMAHEVGHLKAKHPQRSYTITVAVIVVVNLAGFTLAMMLNLSHATPIVICAALACANLVLFFVSRRNERQADAIGITLTGDPEAFISGLAKLSRLNLMPLHAGGWSESLETHPNTMRRFEAIAKVHGIPTDRLQTLLAETVTSAERSYPVVAEDEIDAQVFSSDFKKKYRLRLVLTLLGGLLLAPLPSAVLLAWTNPSGWWLLIFVIVGFVCSFGIYQVVRNLTVFGGHALLARRLRTKLERRGLHDVANHGTLVGLAPADHSRRYEDYSFWDIGVLWLTNEKLYYVGEQTQFALTRDQIKDVYVRNAMPEWLPEKSLYLEWDCNPEAAKTAMHFHAVGETSMLRSRRAIDSLKERVERWRQQTEDFPSATPVLESISAPRFPEITSAAAITSFNLARAFRAALLLACYGGAIGFAVGLPYLSVGYMALVAFLGTIVDELPKLRRAS